MLWRAANSLTRPFQSCRISCHGRVQSIPTGGPTTLRSNFRNKTSKLRRSVLYIVRCPAAKTATGEITASNIAAFSQVTRFYHTTLPGDKRMPSMQLANVDQRRVVSWSLWAYSTCSQAIYDMIVGQEFRFVNQLGLTKMMAVEPP